MSRVVWMDDTSKKTFFVHVLAVSEQDTRIHVF